MSLRIRALLAGGSQGSPNEGGASHHHHHRPHGAAATAAQQRGSLGGCLLEMIASTWVDFYHAAFVSRLESCDAVSGGTHFVIVKV